MRVGEARVAGGLRLYAIGDVHGCNDALGAVHGAIATDLVWRPVADHRIIHVGDYTDRGPDSAGVVERLVELTAREPRVLCLRGNHDQKLLDFLANPAEAAPAFFSFGGKTTLKSYQVGGRGQNYDGLGRQLAQKMPAAHRAFLAGLPYSVRFGDYFFCHAGIRPGVALEAQTADDLMWIRDEFLGDTRDYGVVVVHGHTVTETRQPEIKPNRIDIDTGAVFGGPLTCLVLEGSEMRFL
jgi:serine/threonine protein phosphatase 1